MIIHYERDDGKFYFSRLVFGEKVTSEQMFKSLDKRVRKITKLMKKGCRIRVSWEISSREAPAVCAFAVYYSICRILNMVDGEVFVNQNRQRSFYVFTEPTPGEFWERFNIDDGLLMVEEDGFLIIQLPPIQL